MVPLGTETELRFRARLGNGEKEVRFERSTTRQNSRMQKGFAANVRSARRASRSLANDLKDFEYRAREDPKRWVGPSCIIPS
jgi:hypothetical protein